MELSSLAEESWSPVSSAISWESRLPDGSKLPVSSRSSLSDESLSLTWRRDLLNEVNAVVLDWLNIPLYIGRAMFSVSLVATVTVKGVSVTPNEITPPSHRW